MTIHDWHTKIIMTGGLRTKLMNCQNKTSNLRKSTVIVTYGSTDVAAGWRR